MSWRRRLTLGCGALALSLAACSSSGGGAIPTDTSDATGTADAADATVDATPTCPGNQTLCDDGCYDLDTSRESCGACGTTCAAGELCAAGVCQVTCPAGTTECAGGCVDTDASADHCGACGVACNAGEVCSAGACEVACPGGLTECAGTCVDDQVDPMNCGGCGIACGAGEVCQSGACALSCQASLTDCSGSCIDLATSNDHCGACGMACAPGTDCVAGVCETDCGAFTECAGACVDTQTNAENCGGCGLTCAAGERCEAGACALTCPAAQTDCGGVCTDTQSDPTSCGACGVVCGAGELCQMGTCVLTCEPGRAVCNGGCVDLQSDAQYCGDCATACAVDEACDAGSCIPTCPGAEEKCGGTCVDVANDGANCGGCGIVCGVGEACDAGACAPCTDCLEAATVWGGPNTDRVNDVALTPDGGLISVGEFRQIAQFGDDVHLSVGPRDGVVVSHSPTGRVMWSLPLGGTGFDTIVSVAVDALGNVYVLGEFQSDLVVDATTTLTSAGDTDVFVAKLDPNGVPLWAIGMGSTEAERAGAVALDSTGQVVITGAFRATMGSLTAVGSDDVFVAKLDGNTGAELWSYGAGGTSVDRGHGLAIDSADDVWVVGEYRNTVAWTATNTTVSTSNSALFVATLAGADGSVVAVESGSGGGQFAYDIAFDGAGGFAIVGVTVDSTIGALTLTSRGGQDAFVAHRAADGTWDWGHTFGATANDLASVVAIDAQGTTWVGGYFRDSIALPPIDAVANRDGFIAQVDAAGAVVGGVGLGAEFNDEVHGLAVGTDALWVGGELSGPADLPGIGYRFTSGGQDGFVARYRTAGNVLCSGLVCGGVCTEANADPTNCGGCGVVCGPSELCTDAVCQPLSTGLYITEFNTGAPDYLVLQNRTAAPIDLSNYTVRAWWGGETILNASFQTTLPSTMLPAGASVYVIEAGGLTMPGDILADTTMPFVDSDDLGAAVCQGECTSGAPVVDAFKVDTANFPAPLTWTGTLANVASDADSYFRTGFLGLLPNFLASDWTTGPRSR